MEIVMGPVLKTAAIAAMVALAASASAQAQVTEPVSDTSPFTVPNAAGWSVTLSGCSYTDNGVAITGCAQTGENVVASVVGSTLSLVFVGTNGPTASDFLYDNGTGKQTDLTVNVNVTAPTGQAIYSATDTLSSATSTTGLAAISATENITGASSMTSTLGSSPLLQSETFTPIHGPITGGVDVFAGTGLGGNTTAIPTVTLTYTAVPEPVSTSVLLVGLAGLGFIRRKTRSA
jgi:opacity protein-like surface antigen